MQTANKLLYRGGRLGAALVERAPSMELDWDTRQKSRFDAADSTGRRIGVFLARGSVVRGGDVLVVDDGSLVRVIAKPQPVLRAVARDTFDLLRAAYHLGNRHVALELKPAHLQLEPDHVLAEMLRQLGLTVSEELAPFEPEGGAYGEPAGHGGSPAASHIHSHGHEAPHVHGPNCHHDH